MSGRTRLTDAPQDPRGYAHGHHTVRQVVHDDGTRADDRVRTDPSAGHHRRAQANQRTLADGHIGAHRGSRRHVGERGHDTLMIHRGARVENDARTQSGTRSDHGAGRDHAARPRGHVRCEARERMTRDVQPHTAVLEVARDLLTAGIVPDGHDDRIVRHVRQAADPAENRDAEHALSSPRRVVIEETDHLDRLPHARGDQDVGHDEPLAACADDDDPRAHAIPFRPRRPTRPSITP